MEKLISCTFFLLTAVSTNSDLNKLLQLCTFGNSFTNETGIIYVEVLLPCNKPHVLSYKQVLPGILLGIQDANTRIKKRNREIQWQYNDTQCNNAIAPYQAVEVYKSRRVHLILGPVCDYALSGVSRFIKFWNIPLITAGGFAYDFRKPKNNFSNEFHLLTTIGSSHRGINEALVSFAKSAKWKKFKLLYEPQIHDRYPDMEKFCENSLTAFAEVLRSINFGSYTSFNWNGEITKEDTRTKAKRVLQQQVGNDYAIILTCLSKEVTRNILLAAEELNMIDSGEYVFIEFEYFQSRNHLDWLMTGKSESETVKLKKSMSSVLLVTPYLPDETSSNVTTFFQDLNKTAKVVNSSYQEVNPVAIAFYDAITIYSEVICEMLDEGLDIQNGFLVSNKMKNRTFTGRLGEITMNENGDRLTDYTFLKFNPDNEHFEAIAIYNGATKTLNSEKPINSFWHEEKIPSDTPTCGYDDSKCATSLPRFVIAIISLFTVFCVIGLIAILIFRKYKREAELMSMSWKVQWTDIVFTRAKRNCWGSKVTVNNRGLSRGASFFEMQSALMSSTRMHDEDIHYNSQNTTFSTGFYKGNLVTVKKLPVTKIELTRELLLEMKTLKDLQCDHLVRFIGACVEPRHCCLITEFCAKGTLRVILENEEIQLDRTFKMSLITDIIKGMSYLHSTDLKSHGNLTSSNCVVDSRFVLKVCDFGLPFLRQSNEDNTTNSEKKLWKAPELLRQPNAHDRGTPKGDVYSFAIIIHEIINRQGPFSINSLDLTTSEIIEMVIDCQTVPFRPEIKDLSDDITQLMQKCWAEDPTSRPDFRTIQSMRREAKTTNVNILDNLLSRMEMYANNLETLVEERTADYLDQKKKCEELLYQLLPKSVAGQLIHGETVAAEAFDNVTIYFSDIVGFTAISAESNPMEVVELLNDLYTCFDSVIEHFDVYKVETIGDAYMVVSGLPMRNGNTHAREIARMALALLSKVYTFKIRHKPNDQLNLRIGLHSGPCVAGIVGLKMPRYCLFGDTVNTASRMESTGSALKIHVSSTTKEILDTFTGFVLECRGEIEAKGKGKMITYWLIEETSIDPAKNLHEVKTNYDCDQKLSVQEIV